MSWKYIESTSSYLCRISRTCERLIRQAFPKCGFDSFVAQGIDRIELAGAPGGIEPEEDSNRQRHTGRSAQRPGRDDGCITTVLAQKFGYAHTQHQANDAAAGTKQDRLNQELQ